jgi:hypothetical protein
MITNAALFFFDAVQHAGFAIGRFTSRALFRNHGDALRAFPGVWRGGGLDSFTYRMAGGADRELGRALPACSWASHPLRQVAAHVWPATISTIATCWF